MRSWQWGILGAAAAAVVGAIPAHAAPSLGTLDTYNGPVTIKFSNWENFTGGTIAPNSENFGVLSIDSIKVGNNFLFQQGVNNQWLTGVFADIMVTSVTPSGTGFHGEATGGKINIYLNSSNFDPGQGLGGYAAAGGGCAPGDLCYNGITNVGGELVLSLALASGINSLNPTTTLSSDFNSTTNPITGTAQAYYNVVGGSLASKFDTDTLPTAFGTRDLFAQNTFCPNALSASCGLPIGDWQLLSEDPIRAYVVPEPTTLAVLGFGLLGLGLAVRRRNA